jgi:hypothetical protein
MLGWDLDPRDERNSTYFRLFYDLYPIRISDSGEYTFFYNKSNGHSFKTGSEKINITVAGKSIFSLLVHELIITFILDKNRDFLTKTTSPP